MEKNVKTIPLFVVILIIAAIVAIVIIFNNLNNKTNTKKEDNIELNTSVWVTPLKKYTINGTEDTFKVTHNVYLPDSSQGQTQSWAQNINYEVTIGDLVYTGDIVLNSDYGMNNSKDQNPSYDIEISDYKTNGVLVKITKK